MASVSCLRVCSCNKRTKTTQPSATVAWRVARWGRKAPSFPQFWTANIQMLSKTCYDGVNHLFNTPNCRQLVFCQTFCIKAIGVRSGGEIRTIFLKFRKNFSIFLGKFWNRTITLQYSPIRFSSKWHKNSRELKMLTRLKPKVPLCLWVRAVYHDLLRRVAVRSNQGRNDGGQGAQFPGRRMTMRAPNDWGALKSPSYVTRTSGQYICFWKTSGPNIRAPNLLLGPGAILLRCTPNSNSILLCVVHIYEVRSCTIA